MTAVSLRKTAAVPVHPHDIAEQVDTLYRDGITGLKGAFSRDWAERMREDMMTAFWEAIQRPGGAVGRGPRRWYVEIHPQAFGGFVDLVTHPWVTGICEAVLGPGLRDRRDRLRHPVPGRQEPALASRLPVPARHLPGPAHHLARLQSHGRRRDA